MNRSQLLVRASVRLALALVVAGVVSAGASGCQGEEPRSEEAVYEDVRGRVLGVADNGRALVVNHEAVPGTMPAMTMAMRLEDPSAVEGLTENAPIQFDLVTSNDVYIRNIEQLPDTVRLVLDGAPSGPPQ